ncbi:hypothetical protein [Streptomyces natalensis]|uniref:Uncharacterized protein n=1 Tax=Streptomyces natalensis ATCC 27448 TaxID=1240678 RepID=A0A0D7CL02_9ACTN|nr:hypothetical protein [Streptomyces natalensis]KIZ16894.1 hypothetical protein SNA_18130 [Streptomyces natalensis ATCC 27448]
MSADLAHIAALAAAALLIVAPLLIAAAFTHLANRRRNRLAPELAALERIWRHPARRRRNTRKEPRP